MNILHCNQSAAVNHGSAWLTDRFAVAVVTCSIDNNTTVGHLSREFSHCFWHFLTHGEETNAEGDSILHLFKVD